MSTIPPAPEFVRWTNDQQNRVLACLRAERLRLGASIAAETLPGVRAAKRAELEALAADIEQLAAPNCTIVTPPARRGEEGEVADG